jgi:hypothetical protein
MKKFAIAAITAIAATVSLSNVAQAHRHDDDEWGRHPRHHNVDVIIFHPHRHCKVIKIVGFHHGNKIIKIIKKCG